MLVGRAGLQVVTDNPYLEHPTPLQVSGHLVSCNLFVEGTWLEGKRGERRGGEERKERGGEGGEWRRVEERKEEGRGGEERG